jgi:four helix bundle protein
MTPDDLKARTKKFAVDIIEFARSIPRDRINSEIASQLTNAATSVAAHYRAVCRAKSRADFINKLAGAIEEADESALWLEILRESGICPVSRRRRCGGGRRVDKNPGQIPRNSKGQSAFSSQSQIDHQSPINNRQGIRNPIERSTVANKSPLNIDKRIKITDREILYRRLQFRSRTKH